MKLERRMLGALGLLAASTALLIPACAEDQSSLAIRGVLVPTSDSCTVTADPSALEQLSGAIDVGIAAEYRAPLLVVNQLVQRGDPNKLRTETSRVQLYQADVRIEDAAGGSIARSDGTTAEFSVPITGFVDPGTGTQPGYGITDVLLLDPATVGDLAGTLKATNQATLLVAKVVLHGTTLGGNEITTGEWSYPIDVCYGCLVACPPKADDPAIAGRDCLATDENPTGGSCRIGLDGPTDYRLCRGYEVCTCN